MRLSTLAIPLSAALLVSLAGERATAQLTYQRPQTNPYGRPTVSPYLNLVRPGAAAGINYYGLVRPEFQVNAAINALQQQVASNSADIATDQASGLPNTGHPTQFLNTSHYFQSTGGAAGASRGGAASRSSFTGGAGGRGAGASQLAPPRRR